jgi:hypothetical protein
MMDEYWPSSPFMINTSVPASKQARKISVGDNYLGEIVVGGWDILGLGEARG